MREGGLNWDAFPLRLFAKGNAKFWDPLDLDFSQDAADWVDLNSEQQRSSAYLVTHFAAGGEEAVTQDIQPFLRAMATENRLGDEMYLTQFCFEEAKHTQVFRLWMDAVGLTGDLLPYVAENPPLPRPVLRGTARLPADPRTRSQSGEPGARERHLQPRHRGQPRAHRLLRVAEGVHDPRNPARHAGTRAADRRRRAPPHGVGERSPADGTSPQTTRIGMWCNNVWGGNCYRTRSA